jgi:uncharacterized membrane protein
VTPDTIVLEEGGKKWLVPSDTSEESKSFNLDSWVIFSKVRNARNNLEEVSIHDKLRLDKILILFIIFLTIASIISGFKGLNAFFGLLSTLVIISQYTIPALTVGHNPLLVSTISVISTATISMLIAHGFNRRNYLSLTSTLFTIILAVSFAAFAVWLTGLTGNYSEETMYLTSIPGFGKLDLRGLVDDITTAQVAIADEFSASNPRYPFKVIFQRTMSVGHEHVASLINTLALAYIGTSLPILLALSFLNYEPVWVFLNREFVTQEIVRTICGSIALILAVPISSAVSAFYFWKIHRSNVQVPYNRVKEVFFSRL